MYKQHAYIQHRSSEHKTTHHSTQGRRRVLTRVWYRESKGRVGWEAQPWRIREGSLAGGGEMKVSEQNRGRHDRVTAGKRQAGQLAEGHGEVSSRLAKEKRRVEAPGVWRLPPLHSVTPE